VFENRQERSHLATTAAELADVLYARERFDEADEWTRTAERHAASDDLGAQFTWRSVRGKIVAKAGDFEEAEEFARRALELVDRTDALNQRANVRLDFAHVLFLAKQTDAAAAVASEAADMYEQKGNSVSARVARGMIERLATV
jgi:tetratricopeptide (TPR) repeat protein